MKIFAAIMLVLAFTGYIKIVVNPERYRKEKAEMSNEVIIAGETLVTIAEVLLCGAVIGWW